jgi:hypothetical protein
MHDDLRTNTYASGAFALMVIIVVVIGIALAWNG